MNDPYNIALNYLYKKYGKRELRLVESANKRKLRDKLYVPTESDYIYVIEKEVTNHEDKNILLLLNQYPYGRVVRQELESLLITKGILPTTPKTN